MRSILYKIPIPLPFNFLRINSGVNPLVINYHIVSDERIPHVSNIYKFRNIKRFIEDLNFFSNNYNIISLSELLSSLKNKSELPEKSILITLDDGFKEVYEVVAPILIEKKISPAIFITKNYIDNIELGYDHRKSLLIEKLLSNNNIQDIKILQKILDLNNPDKNALINSIVKIPYKQKALVDTIGYEFKIDFDEYLKENKPYLTSHQVKELISNGFAFGGHSIDHPNFSELNIEEQIMQAKESIDFVCTNFNINYRVFAFPYWDAGVSYEFFNRLSADATFGTQGLLQDKGINNIQRIGIEKYDFAAKRIVKTNYLRKIIFHQLKRDVIKRS